MYCDVVWYVVRDYVDGGVVLVVEVVFEYAGGVRDVEGSGGAVFFGEADAAAGLFVGGAKYRDCFGVEGDRVV